jgi:hypothetical protein
MTARTRWDRPWVLVATVVAVHMVAAVPFLFVAWPGTYAGLTGLPLDDGWIHLVYARALSVFDGFCYNPGQAEAGFSSPLWAVLLVPLFWLKEIVDFPTAYGVKVVGLAVACAASLLAFRLAGRLSGSRVAGWIAALLVAVDPSLSFAKFSGMEVLLAAALVLWGLDELVAAREIPAAMAAALAPLARPELLIFTAIALGILGMRLVRRRASPLRWATAVLPSVITVGGWVGFCLAVTGRPLPNTFYAKHPQGGLWSNFADLPTVFGGMLFDLPWFFLGSGLILFAIGARRILRRETSGTPWPDLLPRIGVAAYPIVFLIGISWAHDLKQDWPFYWNRYFQPVIPCLLVLVAIGWVEIARWSYRQLRSGEGADLRRRMLAVVAALVLALPLLALPLRMLEKSELFAWNCQNINEMQVDVGRWIARNTGPDDWIATNDAGAIRYFGHRRVIDMMGLNNHLVQQRGLASVFGEARPRYFVIFPSWFPKLARDPSLVPVYGVEAQHYSICDCPQELMVVFERRDEEGGTTR